MFRPKSDLTTTREIARKVQRRSLIWSIDFQKFSLEVYGLNNLYQLIYCIEEFKVVFCSFVFKAV